MDFARMIFVTGFARGGTSWLRDCIAAHPDVAKIPGEMTVFRDHAGDRDLIEQAICERVTSVEADTGHRGMFVNKAPANAPHIAEACSMFSEARFVFITRDPRDVFVSHKRGNQRWMSSGANATIDGCMGKIRSYYEAYERARGAGNLLRITYEDLHQNFDTTMQRVFDFVGLTADAKLVSRVHKQQNFWAVASRNIENRDSGKRKGVVGDWVHFLDDPERKWFERDPFWSNHLSTNQYSWTPPTNRSIMDAMVRAGVRFLDEDALLANETSQDRVNALVTHDIDVLNKKMAPSIHEAANIEAELGIPAIYYFLPLDDIRYKGYSRDKIAALITHISERGHAVGLHLNAAERFFPADAPDCGNGHRDIEKSIEYLHVQIDMLESLGVNVRTASAHGYGRRKKIPNNRDTPIFTQELASRGVKSWDNALRPALIHEGVPAHGHLTDVGGALAVKGFTTDERPDSPDLYTSMPQGSVVHVLFHPGNYDFTRPLTLGIRRNARPTKRSISPETAKA